MAESRNLNSGFLHTSFVDSDFTVAKIITILPTGYEPNYYTLPTAFIEEKQPFLERQRYCAAGVRRYVSRTSIVELSASQSRSRQPFLCSESILPRFFAPPGPLRTVPQYAPQFSLSARVPLGLFSITTVFQCKSSAEITIVDPSSSVQDWGTRCAVFEVVLQAIQCSSTGRLSPTRPVT